MSTPLNLFPARIRWCNPDGTLTMEALKMLQILVDRVGGVIGDAGMDTFPVMPPDGDQQQPSFEMICAAAGPASTADAVHPMLAQPATPEAMGEIAMQGASDGSVFVDIIVQPPSTGAAVQSIAATASPMTFTARDHGTLSVLGGAVSLINFSRAGSSIAIGAGLIPLATGDRVTITYSTAPTLNFIPR